MFSKKSSCNSNSGTTSLLRWKLNKEDFSKRLLHVHVHSHEDLKLLCICLWCTSIFTCCRVGEGILLIWHLLLAVSRKNEKKFASLEFLQFYTLEITVWKFHNFSIIQILREINFGDFRSAKLDILTHLSI